MSHHACPPHSLPPGVSADPLLASKALWQVAAPLLHRWARVKTAQGTPAAAYEEPLRAHANSLRQLVLAGGGVEGCLALAPPQLQCLTIPGDPGAQLSRFTALWALSLRASEPWPAWPPSLRQLTIRCKELTDSLLGSLAPLSQLKSLELLCSTVQASPRSKALSRLPLRTLRIALLGAVDEDAETQLPPFSPGLEQLFVSAGHAPCRRSRAS